MISDTCLILFKSSFAAKRTEVLSTWNLLNVLQQKCLFRWFEEHDSKVSGPALVQ